MSFWPVRASGIGPESAKSSHSTLQLHDVAVAEKKRKMLIVTRK